MLVADYGNHLVRHIDLRLDVVEVTTLAEDDAANEASLNGPYDVTINPAQGTAIVTDSNHRPIWQFDLVARELKLRRLGFTAFNPTTTSSGQ